MNAEPRARLTIQLRGRASWQWGDRPPRALTRKQALLLAYVAVEREPLRDKTAEVLGGSVPAMHQAIYELRKSLGAEVLRQENKLRLLPEVECDIFDDASRWSSAALLQRAVFLEGIEPTLGLRTWLANQREGWLVQVVTLLLLRDDELQRLQLLAEALRVARRLTELAPRQELGWRARMWWHLLMNDLGAAADAYSRLLAELPPGRGPSAETEAIWSLVQRGADAAGLPVGENPALRWPPRLIGREAQWAALDAAAAQAHPFLICGESGMGASRLLRSWFAQAGPSIIVIAAPGDDTAPYATLASLVRELDEQYGLRPGSADRRTLGAALPGADVTGAAEPAVTDEDAVCAAFFRLLERAAAEGVRSVGVDGLHDADRATSAVLRRLAGGRLSGRLRFGFTARQPWSAGMQTWLDEWQSSSPPLKLVRLAPLNHEETAELLSLLDLRGSAAAVGSRELHTQVGGNPRALLQTLRELPAGWKPGQPLPRTDTALAALRLTLRALPAELLPMLQLLAVLGPDADHAERALGLLAHETEAWRAELAGRHVLGHGRFVHDNMREVVLASLSDAQRRHWHGVAAEALRHDHRVPPARLALHWAAAERWSEAGLSYGAAAQAADNAGRAGEARMLHEQAVACLRRAGDGPAEFGALFASLPSALLLDDVRPAKALLDRMAELANTPEQEARLALAQAQVAVSHYARGDGALEATARAVELTRSRPDLHGDALGLHAAALAQAGRLEASLDASRQALDCAPWAHWPRRAREVGTHHVYVCWELSRVGEALTLCRELMDAYDAAGDAAGAASMEGHLAVLLLTVDGRQAFEPARSAVERHRAIGPAAGGAMVVMHRVALAVASLHIGRLDVAAEALYEQGRSIGEGMLAGIDAKVRLTQAQRFLLLGDAERALQTLGEDDTGWPAAMQVQRNWALARTARMRGESAAGHLRRMGAIHARQEPKTLAHTAWLEWARQGDAREVADRMAGVQEQYLQAGMPGAARAAKLRRIDRLMDCGDAEATAAAGRLAGELFEALAAGGGLHASVYLPEAWWVLSRALDGVGRLAEAASARERGRAWIDQALPSIAEEDREGFLRRNPVNATLLA